MTILATAAAEPQHGWGGMLGLLAGLFGIYLVWRVDLYFRVRRGDTDAPSPDEVVAPVPLDTRRSRASRLMSRARETRNRVEAIGQAGAVSKEVPGGTWDDGVIDLALDGDDDSEIDGSGFDEADVRVSRETREEYVARCIEKGIPRAEIVKALGEHYGTPRATAYRLVPADAPSRAA